MITRSKDGIFKPKVYSTQTSKLQLSSFDILTKSSSIKEALHHLGFDEKWYIDIVSMFS